MATATLISSDEYLNTSYAPDLEFVDGVLVRKGTGEQPHGKLIAIVTSFFWQSRKSHGLRVFVATRLQLDPERTHRVPDVLVLEKPYKKGRVVEDVPAVVVEVTSPDDRFDDILDKCFDYEKLGVATTIVMDPNNKRAYLFRQGSFQLLKGPFVGLTLPRQQLTIDFPFAQMFAELDED